MPRTLKRRAEVISRDNESETEISVPPTQRPSGRQPQPSNSHDASDANISAASGSNSDSDTAQTQTQTATQTLVKKLVRLALSTEYSRTPLRRSEISTRVLKDSNASRSFKTVFQGAQKILRETFGMQLFELPSREKTGLSERRKAATQQQQATQSRPNASTTAAANKSSQQYILISTLAHAYKTNPEIMAPARAHSTETEAMYTACYTFIISLIYLNNGTIPEAKLERYLKRVGMEQFSPLGGSVATLERLLQRMTREGYVEKRRETSAGEEMVEWAVGPRGKAEVGVGGVAGLVRSVYGYGAVSLTPNEAPGRATSDDEDNAHRQRVKIEWDELEGKLKRSLGVVVNEDGSTEQSRRDPGVAGKDGQAGPKRTRQRRANNDDDDDDDH